jgi:hypothetical protein
MPTGTRPQIGNLVFDEAILLTVTPPATITTAVITFQNVTVPGLLVGDVLSWNLLQQANNLVSIPNMYASAANTLTIGWGTEGGTISSLGSQQILIEVARPENASLGITALPANLA